MDDTAIVQVFDSEDFGEIRAFEQDGKREAIA